MLDLGPYLSSLIGVVALCALAWVHTRSSALYRCLFAVVAGQRNHCEASIEWDELP